MRSKRYGPGRFEALKNFVFSNTKKDRDRKRDAPRPLPLTRPRALTHSPGLSTQPASALLIRLPVEIRRIIWRYCMSRQHMHVVRCPKRLASRPCNSTAASTGASHLDCWDETSENALTSWHGYDRSTPSLQPFPPRGGAREGQKPSSPFALLTTCRVIYCETVELLYAETMLDINHIDTISYLRQTIMPTRFEAIRHLRLEWCFQGCPYTWRAPNDIEWHDKQGAPHDMATWRTVCGAMMGMRGLHELYIVLRFSPTPVWLCAEAWAPLLDPLEQIKQPRVMQVVLQKVAELGLDSNAKYHFKITEAHWLG